MIMGNRVVRAVLRSPLRGFLGGMCELKYAGRRTGRTIALPVQYARDGERLVVNVGRSGAKKWWRNFVEPGPVAVSVNGVDREGIARVVALAAPDRGQVASIYRRSHPKVEVAGDPMVVIDLAPAHGTHR